MIAEPSRVTVARMTLLVELDSACAEEFHSGHISSAPAKEIAAVLKQTGLRLAPLHPGVKDPALRVYFQAEGDRTNEAAEKLQRCRAAKAAYFKPRDEPP